MFTKALLVTIAVSASTVSATRGGLRSFADKGGTRENRFLQALGDWELCSDSDQCSNGCCSNMYSDDWECTPLEEGFVPEDNGCIASTQPGPPAPPSQHYAFKLQLITEEQMDGQILDDIYYAFYAIYPEMAAKYNPNADEAVTIRIHEFDWDGVPAYADSEGVSIKTSHLRASPSDAGGVSVHELMHIVQRGWIADVPGWLIEGFADYARYESQLDVLQGNEWSIPEGYQGGTNYVDGYGTAASFIRFLNDNQIVTVTTLVGKFLDGSFSDGDEVWLEMAGKTLDELWQQYADATG
jgi:Peptidase of plants and bacteria